MSKRGARLARESDTPGHEAASMDTLGTIATLGTTATLGPLLPHATVDSVEATERQLSAECRPSPVNIAEYLPWACRQLNVDADVHVFKVLES